MLWYQKSSALATVFRSTMCGLKKSAWGVFPESWKVLAEQRRRWGRRWQRRKQTKNNKSPGYSGWLNYNFEVIATYPRANELTQDYGNTSVLAMESLQFCTKQHWFLTWSLTELITAAARKNDETEEDDSNVSGYQKLHKIFVLCWFHTQVSTNFLEIL